ncbi:MAG: hypothetical protein IJC99_00020 [Clostridia bacterium]|nr:hypothetical protein [Clostridia bacterium]
MKKMLSAVLALLLALVLLLGGCAKHGKTLIKAGKEKISVNVFMLYLSRMKGALAESGADVTDENYWGQYLSYDHATVADYYTAQVLEGLKHIAAAMIIYEESGLKLPKSTEEEIDKWIDELIEEDGNGSKSALNEILSAYGANITVLRDAAILEAKLTQLKESLYGKGGNKISDAVLEQYYKDTYFRGFQMQLANYYYKHERDDNKIAKRYTDDTHTKIAYLPQSVIDALPEEERAKYAWVAKEGKYANYEAAYGDKILVYRDGETEVVAYDKENGVIWYEEQNGERVKELYTEAEMEERRRKAEQIAAECKGDLEKFMVYVTELSDNSDFHKNSAPTGMYFSVGTYHTDAIFSGFSNALVTMEIGDTCTMTINGSHYVLMRAELDTGAWKNEKNARWFSTLRGLALEYMLQQKTTTYLDRVTVNEDLLEGVDITQVASNIIY